MPLLVVALSSATGGLGGTLRWFAAAALLAALAAIFLGRSAAPRALAPEPGGMITLYGHPFSRAHRVMWMLRELDLPFDHVPTDFIHGGTRTDAFKAVNPNGRVPALVRR